MSDIAAVDCTERWLDVRFASAQRVLSWAIVGGGLRQSDAVVWHYVRREELPLGRDPVALFESRLHERGLADAVGLLTARDLLPYVDVAAEHSGVRARCIATVGLGNALRTGDPPAAGPSGGFPRGTGRRPRATGPPSRSASRRCRASR